MQTRQISWLLQLALRTVQARSGSQQLAKSVPAIVGFAILLINLLEREFHCVAALFGQNPFWRSCSCWERSMLAITCST